MDPSLEPSVAGAALAALAVACGAPLFATGLRVWRLRGHLARLSERPLGESPTGFVRTRGRVVLDSPLFSPISGRPCVGFRLEVRGGGTRVAAVVEERRPFRIAEDGHSARVMAGEARWSLSETARREIPSGEPLTENLASLLARCPEVYWMKRQGVPMLLIERALHAGDECHVVGIARHARPYEMAEEVELARTGTDGTVRAAATQVAAGDDRWPDFERRRPGRPHPGEPDLWFDAGGSLEFMHVSADPPTAASLATPTWRIAGVFLGPALSLAGLLYLAWAAEQLSGWARR